MAAGAAVGMAAGAVVYGLEHPDQVRQFVEDLQEHPFHNPTGLDTPQEISQGLEELRRWVQGHPPFHPSSNPYLA
jgi:hypothetical protein